MKNSGLFSRVFPAVIVATCLLVTAIESASANEARPQSGTISAQSSERVLEIPFDPAFSRAADDRRDDISGVVYGIDGRPAARVAIEVVRAVSPGYADLFERDRDEISRTVARLASDEHGAFSLHADRAQSYELHLRDDAGSIARVDACTAGEHVEIRLAKPATWNVRVLQRSTRAPLAGFTLEARRDLRSGLPQFGTVTRVVSSATTDSEGRASLAELPPGVVELALEPCSSPFSIGSARVQAGEERTFDVWVDARVQSVHGVVFDSEKHPVADAEIARDVEFRDAWRTDSAGRFSIARVLTRNEPITLSARAAHFGIGNASASTPATDLSFEIHLQPATTMRGRFVDQDSKPIAAVDVAVVESPAWRPGQVVHEMRRATSREDGTFEIADLASTGQRLLVATKVGYALCLRELPFAASSAAVYDAHDVVLGAATRLSGTVIGADMRPAPRTLLSLQGKPLARDLLLAGPGLDTRPETLIRALWTDSLGRYTFDGIDAGTYALFASNLYASIRTPTLDLPGERDASTWNIRMPMLARRADLPPSKLSGALEGRAVDPDGRPCCGAVVTLLPDDPNTSRPVSASILEVDDPNQRLPITTFTDERGVFRFDDVAPSCPALLVQRWSGIEGQSALLARRVLEPDSNADAARIVVMPVVAVHGRVVDASAPTGRTWLVRASSTLHAFATACVESDTEGRFTFYLEENGRMTISVLPLNEDASRFKSGDEMRAPSATVVENLVATRDEIVIRIPAR